MQSKQKLSKDEFREMLSLIKRYVTTEMDQWELWKFSTDFGNIYIDISMIPSRPEEAYVDLSHLMNEG